MKHMKQWLYKTWKCCLAITLIFTLFPTTVFANEENLVLDLTKGDVVITQNGYQYAGNSEQAYQGAYTIVGHGTSTSHTITVASNDADITLDNVVINSDRRSPLTIQDGGNATIHLMNDNQFGTGWDGVHATNIVVGNNASLNIDGQGSLYCNESLFYHKLFIGKESKVSLNGGSINLRASYVSVVDGLGTFLVNGANVRLRTDPYDGSSIIPIFSGNHVQLENGTLEIYEKTVSFGAGDVSITGGTLYSDLPNFQLDAKSLMVDGGIIQLAGSIQDELKTNSDAWNAIVFEKNKGQVYGSYNLKEDLCISKNQSLSIDEKSQLTIAEDVTMIIEGSFYNYGKVINKGNLYLTLDAVYDGSNPSVNPLKYQGIFSYIDEQGTTQFIQNPICLRSDDILWESGWYAVNDSVTINDRVEVSGDVQLLLLDRAQLTVKGGIQVSQENGLCVYAQSTDDKMGSLKVIDVEQYHAGIGGSFGQSGGSITLSGGNIHVSATSFGGAGIGGGYSGKTGGDIKITGGKIYAESNDWAAGIGGGYSGSSGQIDISGGEVIAIGSGDSGAGIGAGNEGFVDTIRISGGTIKASAVHGAGIGGCYKNGAGDIHISGGTIEAFSEAGAGIGSGNEGHGGKVSITGGLVYAKSLYGAGIGNGSSVSQEKDSTMFMTGENGNAVIFASSINDQSQKEQWHGVIFEGQEGNVYGKHVILETSFPIPSDTTMNISKGTKLEIPQTVTILNNGTIRVYQGGQYIGIQPKGNEATYEVQWDTNGDGIIEDSSWVSYGMTPSHSDGEKEQTNEYTYQFIGWSPAIEPVTHPIAYTALFDSLDRYYSLAFMQGDGYVIDSENTSQVLYGTEVFFSVDLKPGYTKNDNFAVYANGEKLEEDTNGMYAYIVKADTTITVEGVEDSKAPIIHGITDKQTYYTTQSVSVEEENLSSITVNGVSQSTNFVLKGNTEITYTIVAEDIAGNCTSYTIHMKPIASLKEQLGDVSIENVTSADQEVIDAYIHSLNELLLYDTTTDEEREEIEKMLSDADDLLKCIEAARQSANSEAIHKVRPITPQNVQLKDKIDLENAKKAIETAIEEYGNHYTDEELYTLHVQYERIEENLNQIYRVENIQNKIEQLPNTVKVDDLEQIVQIEQVKKEIDDLSCYEKEMISSNSIQKFERLYLELSNYQILQGEGAEWEKGSKTNITIVANGAVERLEAITVDGQLLDASYYELKSGSTILILHPFYLETLKEGVHTLTFQYDYGSVETTITILPSSQKKEDAGIKEDSSQPTLSEGEENVNTGVSNHSFMWMILAGICVGTIGILSFQKRKK